MNAMVVLEKEGYSILGGRQTIKLSGHQTGGQLGILLSEVPAGSGVPMHVHDREDEIFQLIEGNLEVNVDGQVYLLQKGDMIFLPRGIPHGFKAVSLTRMWVSLTPGGGEEMFVELSALPGTPPDKARMAEVCARYGVSFV